MIFETYFDAFAILSIVTAVMLPLYIATAAFFLRSVLNIHSIKNERAIGVPNIIETLLRTTMGFDPELSEKITKFIEKRENIDAIINMFGNNN